MSSASSPPPAPDRHPVPQAGGQKELFQRDPPPWEVEGEDCQVVATVVFAENPYGPYAYRVPPRLVDVVNPGMRIEVPLGRGNRPMQGWCTEVSAQNLGGRPMKEMLGVIDQAPLCAPKLIQLVLWMAHYYQSPAGQVFDALIPAGVRGGAGTKERTFLVPAPKALDDREVDSLPLKQRGALRHLIAAAKPLTPGELAILADCTEDPIRQLRKKGWVVAEVRRVMDVGSSPGVRPSPSRTPALELTSAQEHALEQITTAISLGQARTLLLHGVTGSGKTEVYIRSIEAGVRAGRSAIVLVPEISLTPQTRQRFEDRFSSVAVLHSQMSPSERHYHWQRIASGQVEVVVGPRSAIFAPLPNLGLIVIDEEHDASFKQDTVPRYHARDVARRRAALEGIPLVLGSATPSLESWHAAQQGLATLITLPERASKRPLPDVRLVDMRLKDHRASGSLSRPLSQAIEETLGQRGQIILLLNRRGFATSIQCPACGHVVPCPDCDLPLTHHRDGSKAICHYCDYQIPTPPWCPACRYDGIRYSGSGTQRLEQEIKGAFPAARVARMDSDTMRKPGSHERVLSSFRKGELEILLGTQMIAKGLDFPDVLLVGVINADTSLHFPDFRAAERTFQLLTQVAGRTGRGTRGGHVIVQTFSPEHPAIVAASQHDFLGFAAVELEQRRKYSYPPFGRVARIIVRGSEERATEEFANQIGARLEGVRTLQGAEVRILGPAPPPIARLRGKYRFHLLLQSLDAAALGNVLRRAREDLKPPAKSDIQYVVDIDPLDML